MRTQTGHRSGASRARNSTRRRLVAIAVALPLVVVACSVDQDGPRAVRSDDLETVDTSDATSPTESTLSTDASTTTSVDDQGASTTTTLEGETTTVPSPDGEAAWTVLVYLAGDNNLEAAAVTDIEEMQAGVTDDMNLLVLMDRAAEGSDVAGYSSAEVPGVGDWVGAKLLSITTGAITDLGMSGDFDMSDPAVLEQFLTIGLTQHPAQHTAVVLWDHGAGWHGFAQDESLNPRNTMQADEVALAMGNALNATGNDKFDVVEYDACLMASLEVASAINPVANYLIASEEVVPNHGLDYSVLGTSLSDDPVTYATGIIDGFYAQAQAQHDDSTSTMSLIDLNAMPAMIDAVNGFAAALSANMTNDVAAFARSGALSSAFGYDADPDQDFMQRDLGQLLDGFTSSDPSVTAAQSNLDAALRSVVLVHTEGASFTGVGGMSVYLPKAPQYYDQDRFGIVPTAGPWSTLLNSFYAVGGTLSEQTRFGFNPSSESQPALSATFDDSGITVSANIEPEGVGTLVSATAIYGFYESSSQTLIGIGQIPADIIDPATGQIGASTPAYNLVFTQGQSILIAFYSVIPSPGSDVTTLSSPVVYMPPGITDWHQGQQAYLILSLAADGTVVQLTAVAQSENGAYGALAMDPAGTLETLLPLYGPNGAFEYVSTGDYSGVLGQPIPADLDQIEIYVQTVVPADNIFADDTPLGIGITATDVGGVTITETAPVPT